MSMSLSFKVVSGMILIVLILTSLLSYFTVDSYQEALEQAYIKKAESLAFSLDATIRKDFGDYPEGALKDIIQENMRLNPDLKSIDINRYDNGLKTIVSSDLSRTETIPDYKNYESYREGSTLSFRVNDTIRVITPLYMWGEKKGTLLVDYGTETIKEKVQSHLRNVLTLFLFVVLISGILSFYLLDRNILRPLSELNKATYLLEQGYYGYSVGIDKGNEIGELARSFNRLSDELNSSKTKMRDYANNLQIKVDEKTEGLRNKVQELKKSKAAILKVMSRLRKSLDEQKRLEKVKSQFLSVTSHELRTPITPMKAQIQMLMEGFMGKVNGEQQDSLKMVLENTERLDRLIEDILDLSKLDSGNMKFYYGDHNLNKLTKEAVETMRLKAEKKGVRINLKNQTVRKMRVDKQRFTQVLFNLINNAIKFTDKGKNIDVSVNRSKEGVLVQVKDEGIGIKKKDLNRIFKAFEQVDASRSRNYEGTGLGLAICKSIISNMKGRMGVESESGKGSNFWFFLPYGG
ncbi:MAG: HAMP domain-containing sensor histidine kinase [Nanobdellota archaeon]